MSHYDDVYEQERWERCSLAYKRSHPAPCPELVSERTKLELLTIDEWLEKIASLEKRLAEKEAIIDWLTRTLVDRGIPQNCGKFVIMEGADERTHEELNKAYQANLWRKAAEEAVKNNE